VTADDTTDDVSVRLPRQGGPADAAAGPPRLLLVEDDPGDALLVEEYLSDARLDADLEWTQTLAGALASAAERPPDCVLLDLHLPDAVGMAAVRRMQRACPDAAVIVLTGLAEDKAGVDAVAAGAQDYMVKGTVSGELLDRAVRYAVQRKHAERTAAQLRVNEQRQAENRRLERGLLPTPLLHDTPITPTSCYLPSREGALLAGDFLDAVQTPDGTVHAVIGDVSGHGPDAAAMGVCLRIAWRSLVLGGHREADLLGPMDRLLGAERTAGAMFATLALLALPPGTGTIQVVLAGHEAPVLIDAEGVRQLRVPPGLALGIAGDEARWQATELPLPQAGALLLCTDGLIEGHAGPGRERLGTDGLLALIASAADRRGQDLLDHLTSTTKALDAGRHLDDVAVLLLEWDRPL
jgi:serine phosphatase RsbU (regulator of sigma subunit)